MSRIQAVLFALFALLIFGAFSVGTAAAANEKANWVVDGSELKGAESAAAEIEGELTLTDLKVPLIGAASVLCSGKFVGNLKVEGGEITGILDLSGNAISSTPLSGTALKCEAVSGCESGTDVELWGLGFPWITHLLFDFTLIPPKFLFHILFGSYELLCLAFGVASTDECTAEDVAGPVENMSPLDPLANFIDTELEAEKQLATCSLGGAESGVLLSDNESGLILSPEGLSIEVVEKP